MLINESGLVRCIKRAYRSAGYAVVTQDDSMAIYTEQWYVQCKRAALPRKVLATIVEHMDMIPDTAPMSIIKDGDPQLIMPDVAMDETSHWRTGERTDTVTMATVIMQGYQIFQPEGGGACYGVSLSDLEIMEREIAEHGQATVVDGDRLLWCGDNEVVALDTVRKARSSWAKEWERAVWNALEGVDLHKEEA